MKAGTRKSSRTRSVIGRPTHKNNSWGRKTVISKNSIGKGTMEDDIAGWYHRLDAPKLDEFG